MDVFFVGVGDLGWTTVASALEEQLSDARDVNLHHRSLGGSSRASRVPVPQALRRHLDFSFRTRRRRLGSVLADIPPGAHIHCFGHLVASPELMTTDGRQYSVTLDGTVAANVAQFGASTQQRSAAALRRRVAAERAILDQSTFVTCTSRWARQSVIESYGIEPTRLHLLPFPTLGTAVRQRSDANWLTFVGNDVARKGGDRLVEWHQAHFADLTELHFVSSDPAARRYQGLRNVVVHGELPNAEVRGSILPRTRVLALPTYYDQSPIVITEAAAAGVPVVASAIAGIPELVLDRASGFVVPPTDDETFVARIGELLGSPPLARQMSQQALRHHAESIRSSDFCKRLLELIVRELRSAPSAVA